jgi:ferric enterobactin receptor
MKKVCTILSALFLCLFVLSALSAQQSPAKKKKTFILNGEVKDEAGQFVEGATVVIESIKKTTTTNKNGYFLFELPEGVYTVKVTFVGCYPLSQKVELYSNQLLRLDIVKSINELQEVEVVDQSKDKNVNSTQTGTSRMTINAIKKLPTLLGEVDVIRSLQTLPGVTTVGEGASGFNVRGGNIDQNLVLMDDIPIFNTSHLLGFYSVFNPEAVRDMTLYRGGTPAQFGGRTSAVLDIKLKEPDLDTFRASGGIGILASRLLLETPIIKEKMSFFVAGRGSYTDVLFPLINNSSINKTKASYYDITSKLRWKLNDKNAVFFTGYFSNDVFKITGDSLSGLEVNATSTRFKWQTQALALRWNHIFSDKMSVNTSLINSQYKPIIEIPDVDFASKLEAGLNHNQLKSDIVYYANAKHKIELGASGILTKINPGSLLPTSAISIINPVILPQEKSVEAGIYLNDEWQMNKTVTLSYGLRYAVYGLLGEGRVFQYEDNLLKDTAKIKGVTTYKSNEVIKLYHGPEPRLSLKIQTGDNSSIKLGYQRMQQFTQLISNTTSALPTARWKMSDTYIKPQIADQVSVGFFKNLKDNAIETSVEVYYKNSANFPDYRSGSNLLLLDAVETVLNQGKSRSYGLEFYLRKKKGRTTGWLTYTYSRSEVLINSPYPEDKPVSGAYYPTNFDKPHVLNIITNYYYNNRINFSANFTYSTGRPITLAQDKYYIDNIYVPNFVNRNRDRIPDYHRLDLSMNIEPNPNKAKRFKSSWNISIYNAYGRRNAYSLFSKTKNNRIYQVLNRAETYRLAIIGAVIPSITYNFKF